MKKPGFVKMAQFVSELDEIADIIESENPKIALAIDQISDKIEKRAYSPQGWLPGRGIKPREWGPGSRFKVQLPGKKYDPGALMVCSNCGYRQRSYGPIFKCPQCGAQMYQEI